ncbi:MAG: DUF2220 domain-containing protein [Clostridia bacterium]|nr:DUF2220 domain-containing protein [Clostridia bacterium]
MDLNRWLETCRKKNITYNEIKKTADCDSEESLYHMVQKCVEDGLLSPVLASKTNGNVLFPIYLKYRISAKNNDLDNEKGQISVLHPILLCSGVLQKKPEDYQKYNAQFQLLNKWLFTHVEAPVPVSRKERSFEIFGEEKQLEDASFVSLLKRLGITPDVLLYYDTPEYCFNDYIPERKSTLRLLICENKDIWFNIRRMMFEQKKFVLFDERFDGVVYGCGNKVSEKNALTSYTGFLGTSDIRYCYWGDIDREGLNIFVKLKRANPGLEITLFTRAYETMLEKSVDYPIPDSQDNREKMEDYSEIYSNFDIDHLSMIKQSIDQNKRIPQEIISFAVLNGTMR